MSHYRQFQTYAAEMLDLYFEDDESATIKFLNVKSALYKEEPLPLIDSLCSKILISSKCLQSYVNKTWYGKEFHKNKNYVWETLVIKTKMFKTTDS